jgi:hypothetical protein
MAKKKTNLKEYKKENLFWKIILWLDQKRTMLIIFIIILFLYSILHEYIHHFTNLSLGYTGKITWGFFSHYLQLDVLPPQMPFDHYFLIVAMPYFVSILFLIILYMLNIIYPKKNVIFSKIAFFPFLDIIWNYLVMIPTAIINGSDDFLNMIKIGAIHSKGAFFSVIIFIIVLILVTFFLFRPFKGIILNMLKYKNAK